MKTMNLLSAGLLSVALMACQGSNPAIDPGEQARLFSADLVHKVVASTRFTADLESIRTLGRTAEAGLNRFTAERVEFPKALTGESDAGLDPDELAESVERFLAVCVLHPDNLQSEEAGLASYRIAGARLCGQDCLATEDAACAEDVDAMRLGVLLHDQGEEMRIEMLVGEQEHRLFEMRLSDKSLELTVDLQSSLSAITAALSAMGEESGRIAEASGRLVLRLSAIDEQSVSLDLAIAEAIGIRIEPEHGPAVEARLASASDALTVTVDSIQNRLSFGAHLKEAYLRWPFERGSETLPLIVDLPGVNAQLELDGKQDEIRLQNLGLGQDTARLLLSEQELLAVTINPSAGHALDLSLNSSEQGLTLTFDPFLTLTAFVDLGHLNEPGLEEEEAMPAELCNQTYRLSLAAESGLPSVWLPEEANQVKMLSGRLQLSSTAVEQTVLVESGACLQVLEDCQAENHAVFDCLQATSCP